MRKIYRKEVIFMKIESKSIEKKYDCYNKTGESLVFNY